jgi:copper chaperone NosL
MRPARAHLAAAFVPLLAASQAAMTASCSAGPARPAAVDTLNDTCGSCRMAVSDKHFSAQIVAPGEEPRFFDDLRCLRDYLLRAPSLPPRAVAYVADHRTGSWVRAARAIYIEVPSLSTPMGSHWVAYADAGSRDADPYARGGAPLPAAAIFGPGPLPDAGADGGGRGGDHDA